MDITKRYKEGNFIPEDLVALKEVRQKEIETFKGELPFVSQQSSLVLHLKDDIKEIDSLLERVKNK